MDLTGGRNTLLNNAQALHHTTGFLPSYLKLFRSGKLEERASQAFRYLGKVRSLRPVLLRQPLADNRGRGLPDGRKSRGV